VEELSGPDQCPTCEARGSPDLFTKAMLNDNLTLLQDAYAA